MTTRAVIAIAVVVAGCQGRSPRAPNASADAPRDAATATATATADTSPTTVTVVAVPDIAFGCNGLGTAIDRMLRDALVGVQDESASMREMLARIVPLMKQVMIRRCTEDAWSVDLIRCITEGQTQEALAACQTELTSEQKKKLEDSIQEVAKVAFATGSNPDPTPLPVGVPARGPISVPECDAFRVALERASRCTGLSPSDQSFVNQQTSSTIVTHPDETTAPVCRDGLDRVQRMMTTAKCAP